MGHLVKCAEILWCSKTGELQYQCTVCLQSFDTHPKCMSHVRPCPRLRPKFLDTTTSTTTPPKKMVVFPLHLPEFVNAGGSLVQHTELDRLSPQVPVKVKDEPRDIDDDDDDDEDDYYSDHFADEDAAAFQLPPIEIKTEPSSNEHTSRASGGAQADPIDIPMNITKPSDIKWLDKLPAAFETITRSEMAFNSLLKKGLRKGKNVKIFSCDICNAHRHTRNHMLQHMAMHINAKLFKCKFCNEKSFNTKKLLWFHIKHMHLKVEDKRIVTCTICGATFRSDYSLRVHHRMHTGERPFSCTICDRRFFAKSYLKKHIKKHAELKMEPSSPETEKEKALSWVTSMTEVRDELPPDEKHFTYTLLRGIKKGRKGNTIECDICGSMQESRRRMVKHMAMHINAKQFHCILCDRSFNTKGLLKMHVKHMHVQKEDLDTVFECDLCSAPFKTQAAMRSHRVIHTRSAEYKCGQCDKEFMKKRHLEEHARRHDMLAVTADGECALDCTWIDEIPKIHEDQSFGEKQFSSMLLKTLRRAPSGGRWIQCDICGSMQESRYRMMRHMAMHINARNFKCILCDKAFNTKKLLMLHVKHMHKQGPPQTYVCEFCAAQFRSVGGLKVHRRIHTNEKPYVCDYCGKSFNYLKSKKQHMRIHMASTETAPRPDIEILQRWLLQLPETNEEATVDEKNFSCMLLRQLRKGRSGKILECELCGSLQDLRKDMLHHMAMHIDAKDYNCIVCGKTFNTKHQLAGHVTHMHMESMAAESPAGHACELCPMVFGSSGGLTKHRRVHAKNRPPAPIVDNNDPQFLMPLEIQWS